MAAEVPSRMSVKDAETAALAAVGVQQQMSFRKTPRGDSQLGLATKQQQIIDFLRQNRGEV